MISFTYHPSPITHHLLPITYYLSPITYHPSPITHHLPPITYHLSPTTYHLSPITYHSPPHPCYHTPIMTSPSHPREAGATLCGVLALVVWSSTIAVSRGLVEQVGLFTTAALTMLIGGGVGMIYQAVTGRLGAVWRLPRAYLFGGGALVVLYQVGLYLAVGRAADHQQVLAVGLVNYLWPGLTLLLSVPLLRRQASVLLLPGAALGFAGVLVGLGGSATAGFFAGLHANPLPYGCALLGAVCWAVYSNLARRVAGDVDGGGMALFLVIAGVVMAAVRLVIPEPAHWTPAALGALAYTALGPVLLAAMLWEVGMRRGRLILLASLSYFTPLVSTLISSAYLHVIPPPNLWLGCLLVIAGAVLSNATVKREGT
ncbi:MAG: aromatic amino acid DMT transporter YddG [Armatimonadota bacterium]